MIRFLKGAITVLYTLFALFTFLLFLCTDSSTIDTFILIVVLLSTGFIVNKFCASEKSIKYKNHLQSIEHNYDVHYQSMIADIEKIEPFKFEHFICDIYKKMGYKDAYTTSESKDFGADVIVTIDNVRTAIQVKHRVSSDYFVSNDAVQQIYAAMPIYECTAGMVITNGIFTEHAKNQAKACNVRLIDSAELYHMVRKVLLSQSEEKEIEIIQT